MLREADSMQEPSMLKPSCKSRAHAKLIVRCAPLDHGARSAAGITSQFVVATALARAPWSRKKLLKCGSSEIGGAAMVPSTAFYSTPPASHLRVAPACAACLPWGAAPQKCGRPLLLCGRNLDGGYDCASDEFMWSPGGSGSTPATAGTTHQHRGGRSLQGKSSASQHQGIAGHQIMRAGRLMAYKLNRMGVDRPH